MKRYKLLASAMVAVALLSVHTSVFGQTTDSTTSKKTKHTKSKAHKETAEETQLRELKESLKVQQEQIDALKSQIAAKSSDVTSAQQTATDAQTQAAAAAASAAQAQAAAAATSTKVDAVSSSVTDLKSTTDGLAETVVAGQKKVEDEIESPSTIHYKGVTITPGGFLAAETVNRTRAINSDINTPFNATPYMNSGQAYTSEFNATARQSRLSVLVSGKTPFGKLNGYYEMDFLGTGITSNGNQSNSYVLRQRLIWGQLVRNSGFTFSGGQMWSLATEVKKGINPVMNDANLPQVIDPQYHVGFMWLRQYGLRAAQSFAGGKANVALSLEAPQVVGFTSSTTPPDFFVGNIGTGGGLYNLSNKYSNNVAPDFVVKVAADPGYGHYEIGGIARFFRSRIYPNQTSNATATVQTGGYNSTVTGGGAFASARFPVTRYLDVGLKVSGGDGINRYVSSQLPDVTVHPNGSLEPLRGAQGLFSLEAHPTKKLDILGYAGTEYAQRTYYTSGTTIYGYAPPSLNVSGCFAEQGTVAPGTGSQGGVFGGSPYDPSSSCGAQTRDITEGTLQFIYRFYSSPTAGRFQFSAQYSYLTKTAWDGLYSGAYGTSSAVYAAPHATNNMFFTSFRYYIP